MTGYWFVVGISGVTNGGKSSIASKLQCEFPSAVVIKQDDYFLDPNHENHVFIEELNHANWELLTSLDMPKMYSDVKSVLDNAPLEKCGVLIIEGFLIMNYKPLTDIMNLKFYLTLTKEECRNRRIKRTYDPPDPDNYFDLCVWPMHEKHYAEVLSQKEIIFLNGNQAQDGIQKYIMEKIRTTRMELEVKAVEETS
ncbi:ribosylnicotinamide kinase [Chamberlinius hualienensis]